MDLLEGHFGDVKNKKINYIYSGMEQIDVIVCLRMIRDGDYFSLKVELS